MRNRILLVLSAALLLAFFGGQALLKSRNPVVLPGTGALALAGGLRSIAAEVIWFRADRLQEEGRYVELAQLANLLTAVEPHTPEVWSYAAWNLAYNVSVMMATFEDRWRWVLSALELLRDRGVAMNPRSPDLYRELAWMFEIKLGANVDSAASTYRREWAKIVSDVRSRGAWEELAMDPKEMLYVEKVTGFDDWTDPQLSAIYWAAKGLRYAVGRDRAFLEEIIRQARVIYAKRHPAP